jgi:hypothetical protein
MTAGSRTHPSATLVTAIARTHSLAVPVTAADRTQDNRRRG